AVVVRVIGGRQRPLRSGLLGLAWVAWPCAVLQAALLLSALASSPLSGAAVMAAFAVGSAPALAAAPWAWSRWRRARGAGQVVGAAWDLRISGAAMVLASGWVLTHGLWERIAVLCGIA
ncbi:MAG TPA: sulfite exporter TauE/SafE family protein, partial [Burkholderiaceae bacterium]